MPVVHEGRELASTVEVAETMLAKARGLMFRRSVPDDYALVFPFDGAGSHTVHMFFVPFPLDVLWLVDGRVTRRERLRPWIGLGRARADTLVELPAGAAAGVEPGDAVRIDPVRSGRNGRA